MKHFWLIALLALLLAACSSPSSNEPSISETEALAAVQKLQANAGVSQSQSLQEVGDQQLADAWAALSAREQKAAKLFLNPTAEDVGSNDSSADLGAQAAGCWYQTWWRYAENIFGKKLWQYNQRLNWCSNGSSITSASRERWGETFWIGWKFKGHIDSAIYGGRGYTYYRAVTQGHFEYGTGPWDIQHQYPRIDSTVYR